MPRLRTLLPGLLVLGLVCGDSAPAHADDSDPCIDASERAVALRKEGKLIEARAELSACSASTCLDAVRMSCQQRLIETIQTIPSVLFLVRDASGRDLSAVRLTVDGKLFADHLDGSSISLNRGEHDFHFEVEGAPPVDRHLLLHEGEQNRREEVIIGKPPPQAPAATVQPPASAPPSPLVPTFALRPTDDDRGSSSGGRTAGFVVGGVGVAGVALGAIFGAVSMSEHNSYVQHCSSIGAPPGTCDQSGISSRNTAAANGNISTIAFVAGGAALATGIVLFAISPGAHGSSQVTAGPSGLSFSGRF